MAYKSTSDKQLLNYEWPQGLQVTATNIAVQGLGSSDAAQLPSQRGPIPHLGLPSQPVAEFELHNGIDVHLLPSRADCCDVLVSSSTGTQPAGPCGSRQADLWQQTGRHVAADRHPDNTLQTASDTALPTGHDCGNVNTSSSNWAYQMPSRHARSAASSKKQVRELEARLEQVTQQFGTLSTENSRLRNRLQMLETVVSFREHQAARRVGVYGPVVPFAQAASTTILGPQPSATQPAVDSAVGLHHGAATASSLQHESQAGMHACLPGCDRAGVSSQPQQPQQSSYKMATYGELLQRAMHSDHAPQPMTDLEFRQWALLLMKSVGHLVASWNTYPTPEVGQEIERWLLENIYKTELGAYLLDKNIHVRNMYINLETGERDFPPEKRDAFWQGVARQMKFEQRQIDSFREALALCDGAVETIAKETEILSQQLSRCLSVSAEEASKASDHGLLGSLSQAEELANTISTKIEKQRAQHSAGIDFIKFQLTAAQMAHLPVASYPYIPDAILWMRACVKVHGHANN